MKKRKLKRIKKLYPFAVFFAALLVLICFKNFDMQFIEKEKKFHIPPPKILKYFSFGFNEAIASTLWLRLLQDFDYCRNDKEKAYNPKAHLDEILKEDLKPSRCDKGWVYTMLDRITDLSPLFKYAYSHGGLMLSIAVDDRRGAQSIIDKGLSYFPSDYNLNYTAGYLYLFEIREPMLAAKSFMAAKRAGGPVWLGSLAARLYHESGSKELATMIMKELVSDKSLNPELKKHMAKRYREMQSD